MGTSPIIIIGMHRSGTTMLSRQLEALGVFMGNKKDSNHEAFFFLRIDEWLMGQCGGSWDNPQAIRYLLENQEVRAQVSDYIRRYLMSTPRTISYLGWQRDVYKRQPDHNDAWRASDPFPGAHRKRAGRIVSDLRSRSRAHAAHRLFRERDGRRRSDTAWRRVAARL